MRCALSFNDNKTLVNQDVSAWGEMQALSEEPSYKEQDIKSNGDKDYLLGYKMAMDDVLASLEAIEDEEERDYLKRVVYGDVAMQLFSILDRQGENDE